MASILSRKKTLLWYIIDKMLLCVLMAWSYRFIIVEIAQKNHVRMLQAQARLVG